MVILSCSLIFLVGLTPAVAAWLVYRQGYLPRRAVRRASYPSRPRQALPSAPGDPERRYIRGVGYMIGDISCRYNARSGYLRCAVNPMGPCKGCSLYQSVET